MYEGIKVQNSGKLIDLNSLEKTNNGELILGGISTLEIFVENGAEYNKAKLQILENNSDIKVSFIDAQGNNIFLILKNLNDMLLGNNDDTPIFKVFDGLEAIASYSTVDDLEAAAAGNDAVLSSGQDGDSLNIGNFQGTDSSDLAGRVDGFVRTTSPISEDFNTNEEALTSEAQANELFEDTIIEGQIETNNVDSENLIFSTVATIDGFTLNTDGTYEFDANSYDYLATGEEEIIEIPIDIEDIDGGSTSTTLTITVNGTNDRPIIKAIDANLGEETSTELDEPGETEIPEEVSEYVRSAEVEGEVFLGGELIELGIHSSGSFGTSGTRPAEFYGTDRDGRLGMTSDADGFNNGEDLRIDYFLPGAPVEEWGIGYKISGIETTGRNAGLSGSEDVDFNVMNTSTGDNTLSAFGTGVLNDTLQTDMDISFHAEDDFYLTSITLTNTSDTTIDEVRYMRSFDPDNTVYYGGSFNTTNTIENTFEAGDDKAVISAMSSDSDRYATVSGSPATILFFSDDSRAVVSTTSGLTTGTVYNPAVYDSAVSKGYSITSDQSIAIAFDVGSLAPGESATVTYYTGLTNRDINEVIDDIETGRQTFYETYSPDSVVDTSDDGLNSIFDGKLSVTDLDDNDLGLHEFHILKDSEGKNIVNVDGPVDSGGNLVINPDDIIVDTIKHDDGTWTYTIEGDFTALRAGEEVTISFQYVADDTRGFDGTDGINESSVSEPQEIKMTITGTNDKPEITSIETSTNESGDQLLTTYIATLDTVTDDDVNDSHTYQVVGDLTINGDYASRSLVSIYEDTSTGEWKYKVEGNFNYLSEGEIATVKFNYTATDDSNGIGESKISDEKTITLEIIGTNDAPEITTVTPTMAFDEIDFTDGSEDNNYYKIITAQDMFDLLGIVDVDSNTVGLSLTANSSLFTKNGSATDPSTNGVIQLNAADVASGWGTVGGAVGDFVIYSEDIDGLNETDGITATFKVRAYDGQAYSAEKTVTVNIDGTNDAPEITTVTPTMAFDEIDFTDGSEDNNYYKIITAQDMFDLLGIVDVDSSTVGLSLTANSSLFTKNGSATDPSTNGVIQLNAADVAAGWGTVGGAVGDFVIYSEDIDGLNETDGITATFKVRAYDGQAYSAEKTVTVNIDGTNDSISGSGIDGYIANMTVFSDTTPNLLLDSGEANTTTNSTGDFTLTGSDLSGTIIGYGGTDVSTGLAFEGIYKAPAGSTLLNPITTLIVDLMNEGKTLEEAKTLIKNNFGIGMSIDLMVDPIAQAVNASTNEETEDYISLQTLNIQINNTIGQLAAVFDGLTAENGDDITNERDASNIIFQELAKLLALQVIDLTDTSDISLLITNILAKFNENLDPDIILDSTIISDTSEIIVNTNNIIISSTSGESDPENAFESLAKTQIAAEETEKQLEDAIDNGSSISDIKDKTDEGNIAFDFDTRTANAEAGAVTKEQIQTIQSFDEDSLFITSGTIDVDRSLDSFNGVSTFPTTQEIILSFNDEDNIKVEIKVNITVRDDGYYEISAVDGQDINQIPQGEIARINLDYTKDGVVETHKLFIEVNGQNDTSVSNLVHSIAENDNPTFAYAGQLLSNDVDNGDSLTYDWNSNSTTMTFSMTGITGLSPVMALNNPLVEQAALELKPLVLDFINNGNLLGLLTLSPETIMTSKLVVSTLKDFYDANSDLKSEIVAIKDFIVLNKNSLIAQSTLSIDDINLLSDALSEENITALENLVDSVQLFFDANPGLKDLAKLILADNIIDPVELASLDPIMLSQVDVLRLQVKAILDANQDLIDLIDIRKVISKLDEISDIDSVNGEITIITSVNQLAAEAMIDIDENTGEYTITNSYFNELPDSTNIELSFDYFTEDSEGQVSNTSKASILITPQDVENIDVSLDSNGVLSVEDNQNIDMLNLLGNLSSNINESDIDSIDLTNGDHILSNLSTIDFEDMVSDTSSNELSIMGDNGDKIKLDLSTWTKDLTDTDLNPTDEVSDDNFVVYTATGSTNQTLTLLIEKGVAVEDI